VDHAQPHPGKYYLETSAGALFSYGIARAWRYGLAGDEVLPKLSMALDGIRSRIAKDDQGRPFVTGISGPTSADKLEEYGKVLLEDDLPYGVGAVIMALTETSGLPPPDHAGGAPWMCSGQRVTARNVPCRLNKCTDEPAEQTGGGKAASGVAWVRCRLRRETMRSCWSVLPRFLVLAWVAASCSNGGGGAHKPDAREPSDALPELADSLVDITDVPGTDAETTSPLTELPHQGPGTPVEPSEGFLDRKAQYLEACLADHGPGKGGLYGQVCRVYSGDGGVNVDAINAACDKVDSREDTSDFAMAALVRLLYLDKDEKLLAPEVRDRIRTTVLNFRYWLDEPGTDKMCFWSENHQVLFHSAELLAGQLFPDEVFPNSGMTGTQHVEHALPRVERWLRERATFGFSEWHSNVYFNEDIPALANLAHFAEDEKVRTRASIVLDLVAMDFAFNTFDGCYATVHGRTYQSHIIGPCNDSTADAAWVMLGLGERKSSGNFSAAFLATGDYFPPWVIEDVAGKIESGFDHRQHDSIDVAEGPLYGIGYEEPDDVVFWAGMAALAAPEVILGTTKLLDTYDLWDGFLFGDIPEPYKSMIKDASGKPNLVQLAKDLAVLSYGIALEGMDTYTWRTDHYQLSGAQDYKGGYWASQTHLWQATLTPQVHVFTSYAGNVGKGGMGDLDFAGLWTGNWIPRVTLHENVGVIQYRTQPIPMLDEYLAGKYSHAYFPKGLMDEWKEDGNWVAGRAGNGLVALYSQHPVNWAQDNDYELIAPEGDNVWVVELGRSSGVSRTGGLSTGSWPLWLRLTSRSAGSRPRTSASSPRRPEKSRSGGPAR